MKTNLREQLTRYQCFIRPKVHFAPEFSFKCACVLGGVRLKSGNYLFYLFFNLYYYYYVMAGTSIHSKM